MRVCLLHVRMCVGVRMTLCFVAAATDGQALGKRNQRAPMNRTLRAFVIEELQRLDRESNRGPRRGGHHLPKGNIRCTTYEYCASIVQLCAHLSNKHTELPKVVVSWTSTWHPRTAH